MGVRALPTIPLFSSSNSVAASGSSSSSSTTQTHRPTTNNPATHPHPHSLPPEYSSIPTAYVPPPGVRVHSRIDPHAEKQALRDSQQSNFQQGITHQLSQRRPPSSPPTPTPNRGSSHPSNSNSNSNSISDNYEMISQSPDPELVSELGDRGYLPVGMDVRDALAKCEDPTLGWSLRFWITISDPLTQHVFFACPATGQCSWDPPVGAFVVPRSPDGEWWELADPTRGNRSYYYNTLTGKTQWTRPGGDAFVIPLGLIQRNALPARPKPTSVNSQSQRSSHSQTGTTPLRQPTTPSRTRSSTVDSSPTKTYPVPPRSPGSSTNLSPSSSYGPTSQTLEAIVLDHFGGSPSPTKTHSSRSHESGNTAASSIQASKSITTISEEEDSHSRPMLLTTSKPVNNPPLSTVEESSGNETDRSDNSVAGWWDKRKSTAFVVKKFASPRKRGNNTKSYQDDLTSPVEGVINAALRGSPLKRERVKIGAPIPESRVAAGSSESDSPSDDNDTTPNALPADMPQEPIYVEHEHDTPVRTKRLSTGLHPLLPSDISTEIQSFQGDEFSRKYFATKRSGVLRQRVPVERIMEWQRTPISAPLLVISRQSTRDAVMTFKVIQHVMGDRDRAVEGAKPIQTSSSHLNLACLALGGRRGDEGHPSRGGKLANGFAANSNGLEGKSEKMIVLDEIRWVVQLCVSNGEMRDEVYCQLIKQLVKNPDHDAVVLGFQLFCVFVNAFGPSKNFEPFVRSALQRYIFEIKDGVGVMAKYCITKLDLFLSKGLRAKALTIGEIEHASDAAFYPSVYGESLERIMDFQKRSYPTLKVPVILPFLADGILALGGMQSEGIFRVPGDGDSVSELKSRMDRGHYQLKGIDDPHVAASLFKLWLRELEDPIVPTAMYNDALTASRSPEECISFVRKLPAYNRRVLLFVVSFIQMFVKGDVVRSTKMTPGNLALVIAPNILRTTSNSLLTVFTNSSFESKFILQLIEHMDPTTVDEEYVPVHGQALGRL